MPNYLYKAKDKTRTVTGEITAESEDDAIRQVERLGYLPIKVSLKTGPASAPASFSSAPASAKALGRAGGSRVSTKDLNTFTRQLAGLVRSKTAVFRALEIVARETRHSGLKAVVERVRDRIKDGASLSDAMLSERCFPRHYVSMVAAGEESGFLQAILLDIVETSEKEEEAASKFRSAMAYPALMAVVGLGTVAAMIMFVMPQMVSLYANVGQELPTGTKILLGLSDLLRRGWPILAAASALTVLAVQKSGVIDKNRVALSRLALATPLIGPYLLQRSVARFCRTLSMLVSRDVEIRSAIASAVPTMGSPALEADMAGLADDVAAGSTFTIALKKIGRFPTYASSLISVGEEAGGLHESLMEVALAYEREADEKLRVFSTLLEPLMILFIGSMVGFVVFSMLSPIFQLNLN